MLRIVMFRKTTSFLGACVRRCRSPLGVLVAAAAVSAVFGAFVDPRGYQLAAGTLAVIAWGLLWPAASAAAVRGELSFAQQRGREGEMTTVTLRLRNRWPLPIWGLAIDEAMGRTSPGSPNSLVGLDVLLPWRTSVWSWPVKLPARGNYPCRAPQVVSGFPFGLWTARRRLRVSQSILVWPATVELEGRELAGQSRIEQAISRRLAGVGGDLFAVRDFRRGDSLKRVHWPQTARHGRLILREHEALGRPTAQILLDTRAEVHAGTGGDASLEWAVRIAASLVERFVRQDVAVELIASGLKPLRVGTRAEQRHCLDALATLQPVESCAGVAIPQVRRATPHDVRIAIATTRSVAMEPATQGRCSSQLWVVLNESRFVGHETTVRRHPQFLPAGAIYLDGPEQVADSFAALWKDHRHVG